MKDVTYRQRNLERLLLFPTLLVGLVLISTACKKDKNKKPHGNDQAKAVYNQAYNENFNSDDISLILAEAKDAYVLVDPFMSGITEHIAAIKANGNEVGGYISIGTTEDWRDDHTDLQPYVVSQVWGAWAGEYFINEVTPQVVDVMKARIDKMADWGCDWVEFDNMDWIFDDAQRLEYGFIVTEAEGIAYYQELCNYVHSKGMKTMAKNTVTQAGSFDGVLYESYDIQKEWWDHAGAQGFLDAGKLVIINHYNETKPNKTYQEYIDLYNAGVSYICESKTEEKYIHYNQD